MFSSKFSFKDFLIFLSSKHFSLKLLTINKIVKKKKRQKSYLVYYVPPALWHSYASWSCFTRLYFFPATPFPLTVQSQNNLCAKVLVQGRVSFKPRHFSCQHPTEGVAFLFGVRETVRASTLQNQEVTWQNSFPFHTLSLQTHRSCSMSEIN